MKGNSKAVYLKIITNNDFRISYISTKNELRATNHNNYNYFKNKY